MQLCKITLKHDFTELNHNTRIFLHTANYLESIKHEIN